ncbi:WD40 repeat domain-containing protein, partial [Candidatus Poribacteria bacterium]|nr:WD40 repeat domain-containing protein [Candidatus Poribacteria bacterium]
DFMKNQILHISTQGVDIDTNVNTWALPEGAIARFGKGEVKDLAFSPDGKYLAVGTWVGVWWYDLSTWSPIALWETERGAIAKIAFSPNGKRLFIFNGDKIIKVYDVPTGDCVSQVKLPYGTSLVDFSAINQHFTTSDMNFSVVYVWCADTCEKIAELSIEPEITLEKRRYKVRPLCFSPDGQRLAHATPVDTKGTADFISVWDMNTFEPIASIRDYTTQIDTLAFSPCGKFLAVGDASGTLKEWDIINGSLTDNQIETSSDYPDRIQIIPSYTTSGQLRAACGSSSKIAVWNVEDSEKIDAFEYGWYIRSYNFLNGTHLAVRDPLKVWIENSSDRGVRLLGHSSISVLPTFSPDGKTLVSEDGGSAMCWDISEKKWQRRIYDKKRSISQVYFSPEGSMHARGNVWNTNTGIVWNVETDEVLATFTEPDTRLIASASAPTTGACAFGDLEGNCYVFDGKEPLKILSGHTGAIQSIAFSADGEQLACTSEEGSAYVWDVASGQQVATLSTTWRIDTNLYIGDANQLQRRLKILKNTSRPSTPGRVKTIVFSPSRDVIAGGKSLEIRLWDAATHEVRLAILLPTGCTQPYALAFTPCGRYLASGSWWDGTEKVSIRLWDVANGENVATLWSHSTDVEYLAFSPDGTLLASGSFDGTILLWDLKPYLNT